jgi:hypothetical protein
LCSKREKLHFMEKREGERKKVTPFDLTWDMIIYAPLYALLVLLIFAAISGLMIWGLEQVTGQELIGEGIRSGMLPAIKNGMKGNRYA